MDILNKDQIDEFLNAARENGHMCRAIKGPPPIGMTYDDGALVENDVNHGWFNVSTCERLDVVYGDRDKSS